MSPRNRWHPTGRAGGDRRRRGAGTSAWRQRRVRAGEASSVARTNRALVGRERVPVRASLAAVGLVLSTLVLLWVIVQTRRVLVWVVVAAFFAVALYPVVNWVQRRLTRCRRSLATLVVFLLVFA